MIDETIEELRKLKDDMGYDTESSDMVYVLNKAIIACEQLKKARKKAKRWKRKYLRITNHYCVGVAISIVGDKYEFKFTDGTTKITDCIVDKRKGAE